MPTAPYRPCAASGCGVLVRRGRCPAHTRQIDQARETATRRGYSSSWHRVFKPQFLGRLVQAGIVPVCGAALPDGPTTTASQCRADGVLTFTSLDGSALHFHHEPPLRDDERHDPAKVCDPWRIVLLCAACHATTTATAAPRWGEVDRGRDLGPAAEKGLPRSGRGGSPLAP